MARKPNYNWDKQPQWVNYYVADLNLKVSDLEDEVERLESIVATLEGMFERASIVEIDGLEVDNTVEVAYGDVHDESTTCPTSGTADYCSCADGL